MVNTHALCILVESVETPALVARSDLLHFHHLGPAEDVRELDWAPLFFLVLNDFLDALLHSSPLLDGFVEFVALVSVLVSTYDKIS